MNTNGKRIGVVGLIFSIMIGGLFMMSCGDGAGGPSENPNQNTPGGNTGGTQNNPGGGTGSGNNQGGNQNQNNMIRITVVDLPEIGIAFNLRMGRVGSTAYTMHRTLPPPEGNVAIFEEDSRSQQLGNLSSGNYRLELIRSNQPRPEWKIESIHLNLGENTVSFTAFSGFYD